jgi:hypothetical protein
MFPFNIITKSFLIRLCYLVLGVLIIGGVIDLFFAAQKNERPQSLAIPQKQGNTAGRNMRELERQIIKESFDDAVRINTARAGDAESMAELGRRENQDPVEKLKWFRLSGLHGNKESEALANSMERDLRKGQKEEADRRVQTELMTIAVNKKKNDELWEGIRRAQKTGSEKAGGAGKK